MVAVSKTFTLLPGLVYNINLFPFHPEQAADYDRTDHIMQIQYHIILKLNQGRSKPEQSAQCLFRSLRIDAYHVHIRRSVHEDRYQECLRKNSKRILRIRFGGRVNHRNRHSDIAYS